MIATPASIEEAQQLLARSSGTVAFAGNGEAPAADTIIRTTSLDRLVEYAPSDQVVTVECGVTLRKLQDELAKNRQRLALDPPQPEKATLGGIVAANAFGPLRTRYGSVRDLIIGVSILRADGTRAKGGGKVVKTVAGFDLPKLACGSRGTLGMIATVTFRVHPLPEESVTLAARGVGAAGVVEWVRKVRALQLEPAAMLAVQGPASWDVFLRFEGFRAGVSQQREKLRELSEAPASIWDEHLASRGPVRFGALPTQLPRLEPLFARGALSWYPTLGLGFAAQRPSASGELIAGGGWLADGESVLPVPPSLPLHRAVKERMDPQNRLAPGTFVGGI